MWRGISLYVQARSIRTPSWQDLSYVFPFKLAAHPSPFTGQIGQLLLPACLPRFSAGFSGLTNTKPWPLSRISLSFWALSIVAWLGYLCGLFQGGASQGGPTQGGPPQGGPFPAPLMLPSSRLIGWWVTAAFIDTAPRPKADGSKKIKYNSACC